MAIQVLKWSLVLLAATSNQTLAWKLLTRPHLHTLFNLSMGFFFLWVGVFSPILFHEYGNLLTEMVDHPDTGVPELCLSVYMVSALIIQCVKVFMFNILFR